MNFNTAWKPYERLGSFFRIAGGELVCAPMDTNGGFDPEEVHSVDFYNCEDPIECTLVYYELASGRAAQWHTLDVMKAEASNATSREGEVSVAMRAWIRHYRECSTCSEEGLPSDRLCETGAIFRAQTRATERRS